MHVASLAAGRTVESRQALKNSHAFAPRNRFAALQALRDRWRQEGQEHFSLLKPLPMGLERWGVVGACLRSVRVTQCTHSLSYVLHAMRRGRVFRFAGPHRALLLTGSSSIKQRERCAGTKCGADIDHREVLTHAIGRALSAADHWRGGERSLPAPDVDHSQSDALEAQMDGGTQATRVEANNCNGRSGVTFDHTAVLPGPLATTARTTTLRSGGSASGRSPPHATWPPPPAHPAPRQECAYVSALSDRAKKPLRQGQETASSTRWSWSAQRSSSKEFEAVVLGGRRSVVVAGGVRVVLLVERD